MNQPIPGRVSSSEESTLPTESVWTIDDLTRRFNVSSKTICRWRQHGLLGRRQTVDGRQRTVFERHIVERFARHNRERILRGSRFSQLSDDERRRIRTQARDLSEQGVPAPRLVERLSQETGRSVEAIRNTLKQLDRESAAPPILGRRRRGARAADLVYARYLQGTPVLELASTLDLTPLAVRRVIARRRALHISELPLDFIPSAEFERSDAARVILGTMPPGRRHTPPPTRGLPSYLASLYEVPLLTPDQERFLFRKYNFLKHQASGLRATLDGKRPNSRTLDEIERLYRAAVATKNSILRANLRLAVAVAKQFTRENESLFDRISDGNVSLMRAVEKFDYGRGFRFSTYATWALRKNFGRAFKVEMKRLRRMNLATDDLLASQTDHRNDPVKAERLQAERERGVRQILRGLDDREQQIIRNRFGLNGKTEPMTLCQIGEQLGVSKERVRQLATRALAKLKKAAVKRELFV